MERVRRGSPGHGDDLVAGGERLADEQAARGTVGTEDDDAHALLLESWIRLAQIL
jgi:hypothetical protein